MGQQSDPEEVEEVERCAPMAQQNLHSVSASSHQAPVRPLQHLSSSGPRPWQTNCCLLANPSLAHLFDASLARGFDASPAHPFAATPALDASLAQPVDASLAHPLDACVPPPPPLDDAFYCAPPLPLGAFLPSHAALAPPSDVLPLLLCVASLILVRPMPSLTLPPHHPGISTCAVPPLSHVASPGHGLPASATPPILLLSSWRSFLPKSPARAASTPRALPFASPPPRLASSVPELL
mmetsp:Transcript_7331/g.13144  ORF Transcript_7331/g.13144 Transcript_7331/m.13144 type:complete len:238 (-) Transcript_7331:653-1366(-)